MKKGFRFIVILCGILFVVGAAVIAVSFFTGGSPEAIRSHGNLEGFRDYLVSLVPLLGQLL